MDDALPNARYRPGPERCDHEPHQHRRGRYNAECHAMREAIIALRTQPRLRRLAEAMCQAPSVDLD
jgi:hypothetical protein